MRHKCPFHIRNFEQIKHCTWKIVATCLSIIFLTFYSPSIYAEDVVVVVNKETHTTSPISRHVLSAIFGMRLTTWSDGMAIKVYVLPDENHIHSLFCKQVLHIFPHQLRSAWDRLVYSGTGQSPDVLSSESDMRARLKNTPGSIGYLTKETLDDSLTILPVE